MAKKPFRLVTLLGIRPDLIRMFKLIKMLDKGQAEHGYEHVFMHTGQHFDHELDGVFYRELGIRKPDFNFGVGKTLKQRGGPATHAYQTALLFGRHEWPVRHAVLTYSRIRMDLAINYMTMNGITKGKLKVFGGAQWRPFIHVNDIGHFTVDSLFKQHTGVFNLATENVTIIDVAEKIKAATGCEVEKTEQKFQDNRNYNADTSKALKAGILPTGTSNNIDFGIEQVKKLVNENRVTNLEHEFYSNERRMLAFMDAYNRFETATKS